MSEILPHTAISSAVEDVVGLARCLAAAGLSTVPIPCNGTKVPCMKWKHLQERIPSADEIGQLYRGIVGLAVINGRVSGNKETLDIDDPKLVEPFEAAVNALLPGLLDRLTVVATPRENCEGRHYHYRVERPVPGSTKLAMSEPRPQFNRDGTPVIDPPTGQVRTCPDTLIETRGEGAYSLIPGCPGACHETGLKYERLSGPPLTELSTISAAEHEALWTIARSFNRYVGQRDVRCGTTARARSRKAVDAASMPALRALYPASDSSVTANRSPRRAIRWRVAHGRSDSTAR